jgi:segregation and condensation protein B
MNSEFIKNVVEAALMVAEKPLSVQQLVALFDPAEQDDVAEAVTVALVQLQEDFAGRGIELKKVASGYRFQARAEFAPWVNRLWEERPARYSHAFMETLAIIAYRQPITRAEIEEIRGVAVSSSIVRTLMEREWLRVAGHRDVPGRPAVYVTTTQFLDYFNLTSLADLPALSEPGNIEQFAGELEGQDMAIETDKDPDAMAAEQNAGVVIVPEAEEQADEFVADQDIITVDDNAEQTLDDASTIATENPNPARAYSDLTEISLADLGALSEDEVSAKLALVEAAVDNFDADDQDDRAPQAAQSN